MFWGILSEATSSLDSRFLVILWWGTWAVGPWVLSRLSKLEVLCKVRCLVIGRGVLKVDILLGVYELGIEVCVEFGPNVSF